MKNETARREIESLDYYLQNHTDDYSEESHTAMMMAIDALSGSEKQTEWVTVNSPEDYPKESGDYLTVLKNTSFRNNEYTDITSFDCDGILAEWDLKPQYKVVAWKYFEPYKGDTE